jgi:hypothetical protein
MSVCAVGASTSDLLDPAKARTNALCGVILAVWTSKLLAATVPTIAGGFAVHLNPSLDWRVLGFAAAISVATTVLCGLWPARRTSQASRMVAFKGEIQAGTPRRWPIGLVTQVVTSLVLPFVAGSFVQALLRLNATDPGFDVTRRLYAYVFVPSPPFTPESGHEFYSQAVEGLTIRLWRCGTSERLRVSEDSRGIDSKCAASRHKR